MQKKEKMPLVEAARPLGELVYEQLRMAIINGDLKSGERLMEIQLSEQLGVSRTPVREAIKKLSREDLIEMIPRKGAYVRQMRQKDVLEVLELRKVLEGFAAEKAARAISDHKAEVMKQLIVDFDNSLQAKDSKALALADDAFHEAIYEAANNQRLALTMKSLHESLLRFRTLYYEAFEDHKQLVDAHKKILDAIINNNSVAARAYTDQHLDYIIANVQQWFEQNQEQFSSH